MVARQVVVLVVVVLYFNWKGEAFSCLGGEQKFMGVIPIGFSTVRVGTPPCPMNQGGAIRAWVSNSNPIGISSFESIEQLIGR